ncbi:MAG: S-layer homology domain-containing protein [Clostridia bacterium]|nr:S-layer homology domain-containing protein [Clostridia bacterium]
MKRFLFFTIMLAVFFSLNVFASEKISPAIDVIAQENGMVKAGIVYDGEINFDVNDFDDNIGVNVSSITISALPKEKDGRLMLDNLYVVENQVISREDFSSLRFIPKSSKEGIYTFKFYPNSSAYEIECELKVIREVNLSPVGANGESISAWTATNISSFGSLSGYDPEGDELKFEIVSLPEKGLIEITNAKTGDYKYTPYENKRGSDAFTYRVRDEYGNYSGETTVTIDIERLDTDIVFSDMRNHRSLNAAYIVTMNEIMTVEQNSDGSFMFNPDKCITKEEFVFLVMNTMGAKDVPTLTKTRFADDEDISPEYKGYLESAFSLGIISGERRNDGIHINPKSEITTAEASVIINNIIGANIESSMSVFADESDIPTWAKSSLVSLNELGIIPKVNGKINPNSPLTRAQTAQILMSLLEYRGKLPH